MVAGQALLPPTLGLVAIRILGIDEAGRGALLGPLVVAGVLVEEEALSRLRSLGVADSKTVPRKRRKKLLVELLPLASGGRVRVIPPEDIDTRNLTELELSAAAELIGILTPGHVVLDAPVSPRAIPSFRKRLAARLHSMGEKVPPLSIAPKADRDSPVVGLASILAKVTRDAYVVWLRKRFGDFGWGYPGERAVRKFLRDWWEAHGDLPPICRRRWATVNKVLDPTLHIGSTSQKRDRTCN